MISCHKKFLAENGISFFFLLYLKQSGITWFDLRLPQGGKSANKPEIMFEILCKK